jgi:hypothetical protein
LVWDAISNTPLFGERKDFRSAADLCPLLERVKAMDVPLIGATTDKETGLVRAIAKVFPSVPHHFCHTHFFKNCAKPLASDLKALGESIERRAEAVRKIAKRLHEAQRQSKPTEPGASEKPRESAPAARPPRSEPTGLATPAAEPQVSPPPRNTPTEADAALELCAIVRQNAHASGKAPLKPPELERHQRLEHVREAIDKEREKRG